MSEEKKNKITMSQINELIAALQEVLPTKRYLHTLGVAYLAAGIAMAYGKNPRKAMVAGLLHDCAKCLPDEEILAQCMTYGLPVAEIEQKQPFLLHGKLGAWYAEHKYGISDEKILDAIRFHTTGRPGMTFLEKNIYISDYIEIGRKQPTAPPLEELRQMVFTDIDRAVYYAAKNTVDYIVATTDADDLDNKLDSMTLETMNYYQEVCRHGK